MCVSRAKISRDGVDPIALYTVKGRRARRVTLGFGTESPSKLRVPRGAGFCPIAVYRITSDGFMRNPGREGGNPNGFGFRNACLSGPDM